MRIVRAQVAKRTAAKVEGTQRRVPLEPELGDLARRIFARRGIEPQLEPLERWERARQRTQPAQVVGTRDGKTQATEHRPFAIRQATCDVDERLRAHTQLDVGEPVGLRIAQERADLRCALRATPAIGNQLVFASTAICGVVFGIGLLRRYALLEVLKSSISLAVAAVPEGLPAVATTTLALASGACAGTAC